VYQKKINNLTEDNEVVDMRVPMLGEKKPFVYIKKRPEEKRFSNENSKVHVADKESMFSEKEIKSIEKFRRLMGADLAEVDVLRDQGDGRIYIVDINNTPWGPPNGLSEAQKGRALRILSQAFMEMIESRVHP
jgi:glutathione synthase/RimK-type ligase-like ATP-grasp enzyme